MKLPFKKKVDHINLVILFISLILTSCQSEQKAEIHQIVKGSIGGKLEVTLTPHLKNTFRSYNLPGLAIGVVKGKDLVYAKAFGKSNTTSEDKLTLGSVFHLASISKLFVATAIMQLAEQGKINLNDPITKHLTYFKLNDSRFKDITIQQMLTHTSGIPDTDNYEWQNPRYDRNALEDYVKEISSLSLQSNPGDSYSYSNIAFEVLGDLVAKVSGMSFEDYQKENILSSVGMTSSTFLKPEDLPDNWVTPHMRFSYNKPWNVYPYNRKHAPSSTLHSNILDMAKWAVMNLNKGKIKGKQILKSESYKKMWKPWMHRAKDRYIGLSWFISSFHGKTIYSHSGSDVGFTANFVIVPEENIGVIVLSNVSDAPVSYITGDILRVLLGKDLVSRKIPAFIPISITYKEYGLKAAVDQWKELKKSKADQYDFSPNTFSALFSAMFLDDEKEAESLSVLTKAIFPKEIQDIVISEATNHKKRFPHNKASQAILNIFKQKD